ncbi:iron ABC transporter substrate-binding protein [Thermotoga maritima MSB8]|uniref:Iron(III) ABC transporter, periplasmic-binding protein, putative n=1 Tax=Thermotoga maritima (strain ATCC 43589 / DSM 3109 / JCM 10099 / NBRC 100826 / MSB8) TaxID=243274 RepID=Q9WXT5_THEMA|nr:iron(III) ABC transporter, periplasmic-binding protein, putative [Thermotoga maritima MSB8]AGL49003.1 Vitamin B12 ABC transporter, B12-binding component BtuF [Thermotoga maritima MSB8]AKE26026.1 iron ABC transporter substrate-binding protein [Thermotoga maritima]AKE27888.1 iron ABC transporter substrate-binding protein [Thermotoga maritima MSB8]AKE29761.1 iron ABC transporter substrate-binding protein [Thermotoga maritima]
MIRKPGNPPAVKGNHLPRHQEGGNILFQGGMEVFRKLVSLILLFVTAVALAVTVVDNAGRVVEITSAPERVVSLSPAATRFLVFLGLEDKIVGVTDYDSYEAEKVGAMVPVNIEKVVSLNPDLVLMFGGFQLPEVPKLEKAGLKVLVVNPNSLNDIIRDVVLLGTIFDRRDLALEKSEKLREKMLEIGKKTYNVPPSKRPKVLYLISSPGPDVKEIWTCGMGSYLNEIISLAGGVNIASGIAGPNGWPQLSIEYVVSQNPDVIIVGVYIPGTENEEIKKILNFEPFKEINAVKNKRVFAVDGNVASQPSPDVFELLDLFYEFFYGGKGE